jgi:1-acyl-sn-glycerol-3-phosphate acyltransferase
VVLIAAGRSRIVAKTEVRGWPVIGRIARYTGTIFVDRSRPLTLPASVAEVREALAAGDAVSVFPEGTTSCGRTVRRFRPAFLQAAVDTGAPVVPVTLRFALAGAGRTSGAAFIGDDTLLDSIRRIIRLRGLRISACHGTTIYPAPGATRGALARMAAAAVGASVPSIRLATVPVPAPIAVPAPRAVPVVPVAPPVPAPAALPAPALRSAA